MRRVGIDSPNLMPSGVLALAQLSSAGRGNARGGGVGFWWLGLALSGGSSDDLVRGAMRLGAVVISTCRSSGSSRAARLPHSDPDAFLYCTPAVAMSVLVSPPPLCAIRIHSFVYPLLPRGAE